MSKKKLTKEQLESVAGLPSRQAAEMLGVGKTTINDARQAAHKKKDGVEVYPGDPALIGDETNAESYHEVWDGSKGVITVVIHEEMTHDNILRKFGHDPAKVRITSTMEETHWQYNGNDWNHRYKFKTEKLTDDQPALESIIKSIQNFEFLPQSKARSPHTEIIVPSDLQIGKVDWHGGTQDTIDQALESFWQFREFVRMTEPQEIVMMDAGDIIENIYNTSSQLGTNDTDLPHQVEIASHIMLEGIKMLAPMSPSLKYKAVPSNHGAHRLGAKSPAGDVHADYGIVIAKMLGRAMTLNPESFGHVAVQVPEAYFDSLYFETSGSQIGMVHGHQAAGADKLGDWWKGQSHGNMPLSKARILVAGHWHSLRLYQSGDARWVMIGPASDRGSSWFTNARGESSQSGMLAFSVVNNQWSNVTIY